MNSSNKFNLILLPDEILLKIFKDKALSSKDILNLCMTCHRFEYICESEDLWKSRFIQKWPWIWKRILYQPNVAKDWKREVCSGIKLAKRFNEKLLTLSHQLYMHQNITTPVLTSILSLLDAGSFGALICLNELREILKQTGHPTASPPGGVSRPLNERGGRKDRGWNPLLSQRPNWIRVLPGQCNNGTTRSFHLPNYRNLTKKYYAQLVLQQLHQIECREDWKHFFSLPPSKQTLERGSFYFAKWFQPKQFLEFEFEHMTTKLDSVALQILSHLRNKYPHHPAVAHKLLDPNEPLADNMWQKRECEQLFDCINHIFFSVNKYQGNEDYYLMDNSLINKVIETKRGIPVTLSILYQAVCYRLGIVLYPVNCPSHFMMKWRPPNTDDIEFIDAFHRGVRTEARAMLLGNHPTILGRGRVACSTLRVLERMSNNTMHVAQRNSQHQDRFKELCCAAEISSICKPDDVDTLEFLYNLYLRLGLHPDRIISGCSEMLEAKLLAPHKTERFSRLQEDAEVLLEIQRRDPQPLIPKRRSAVDNVRLATGMVMRHKLYGYTCVIFGWDTKCMMPMDWILQMNVHSLEYQHNQPFYNVLVADGSQRYAAQENLLDTEPVLVNHEEVGKYFDQFNGQHYVPNNELAAEYPDEETVRNRYYPHLYK